MKRQSRIGIQNLFVEYLIVIDSTVYNNFVSNYGSLTFSLLAQYINIFFTQIVCGVSFFLNSYFNYFFAVFFYR
jgi:hypothetical protein